MKITVNDVDLNMSAEYAEYIGLMKAAVVKPGEAPVGSDAEMVKKILVDNYAAVIQQHPTVRPRSVAEQMKALEAQAAAVFSQAVEKAVSL